MCSEFPIMKFLCCIILTTFLFGDKTAFAEKEITNAVKDLLACVQEKLIENDMQDFTINKLAIADNVYMSNLHVIGLPNWELKNLEISVQILPSPLTITVDLNINFPNFQASGFHLSNLFGLVNSNGSFYVNLENASLEAGFRIMLLENNFISDNFAPNFDKLEFELTGVNLFDDNNGDLKYDESTNFHVRTKSKHIENIEDLLEILKDLASCLPF